MQSQEFFLKMTDGTSRYCRQWLPDGGSKNIIILLHGLGEHTGRYTPIAELLAGWGYTLTGFDLFGHGKSYGPRGHYESFDRIMDDITEFLTDVKRKFSPEKTFLYGHSLGGNLGVNYILRLKPELTGAVITSPGFRTGTPVAGWKLTLAKTLCNLLPKFSLANGLDLDNLSNDPAVKVAYLADPLVHDKVTARFGWDFLQAGEWAMEHAEELSIPILLQQGGNDHIVSVAASREFASKTKMCIYKEWEGLCHETHNEANRSEVIKVMVDWMKKQ
jgi:alpha-beta hydrolase superfamily lysophospholipase